MLPKISCLVLIAATLVFADLQALNDFKKSNHLFTSDLYQELSEQKPTENFLFCPFSTEAILSLVQNGAKGPTAREINAALYRTNSSKRQTNSIYRRFLHEFKTKTDYNLTIANKVYIKNDLKVKEKFSRQVEKNYKSTIENVDFSKKQAAVQLINNWVAEKTNNKIQDLVSEESLHENTAAILINALHFQATWRRPFKKTLTAKKDFFRGADDIVQVDAITRKDFYNYYESKKLAAKLLQIPFRGNDVHLVVVLPDATDGLQALANQHKQKLFKDVKFGLQYTELVLPKFKLESSLDLKQILMNLGVKKAFSRADFSDMAGESGDIFISDIIQKTYIGVDEHGIEASAATAVYFRPKSLMDYSDMKSFIVDRPFLFYIEADGVILFAGRVVDPTL